MRVVVAIIKNDWGEAVAAIQFEGWKEATLWCVDHPSMKNLKRVQLLDLNKPEDVKVEEL